MLLLMKRNPITWTHEMVSFLTEHYPKQGKMWCAHEMNLKEHQVRHKASALHLTARGTSEAWLNGQIQAALSKIGKKRPEQALIMKRVIHDKGLHLNRTSEQISKHMKEWIQKNGHPKGATGMIHSDKSKKIMSQKSKQRYDNMSEEQKALIVLKSMKTKVANGTANKASGHGSWKAQWREIGGQRKFFRSRWEANYARYLEHLIDRGVILKWEHEPETFWFEGVKRGTVSYLPDFKITNMDGSVEYHEVKGWMDDKSKTKIKRMAKYHPDIKLIVVATKEYKALEKMYAYTIDGWEHKNLSKSIA